MECTIIVVYVLNTVEQRRNLWDKLTGISHMPAKSWLVCGDFNLILYHANRLIENPVNFNEIKDFSDCINSLMLSKLPCKGRIPIGKAHCR